MLIQHFAYYCKKNLREINFFSKMNNIFINEQPNNINEKK